MSWASQIEGWLLEGHSINIVGLSGSGRTSALDQVQAVLEADRSLWSSIRWSNAEIVDWTDAKLVAELQSLKSTERIPVVLIDDFGELLVGPAGKRLEQKLFTLVNEANGDCETLRCVLVTAPRDRNIQVPGSGLRERCKTVFPPPDHVADEVVGRFGCVNTSELRAFCGGSQLLAPARRALAAEERGRAMQQAVAAVVTWSGQLRGEHHRRLGEVLARPKATPSTWREGGIDEALDPMVIRDGSGKCHVVDAVRSSRISELLITERWPSKNTDASARRFVARCGNEPAPRWIDNFLSDTGWLQPSLLVRFLSSVLLSLGGRPLEILSRVQVSKSAIDPAQVAADLRTAGITPAQEKLLRWRMYDSKPGNLHDRQLLLPGRTEAFKLPPATVIVGQALPGNESDAELLVQDHSAAKAAWSTATPIW
jgi:hypothetical protein